MEYDVDQAVWFSNTDDGKPVRAVIVEQTEWGYDPGCDCCSREPDRYKVRLEDGTEEVTPEYYLEPRYEV